MVWLLARPITSDGGTDESAYGGGLSLRRADLTLQEVSLAQLKSQQRCAQPDAEQGVRCR